ncbi:MAG: class I SAM-dependent methyltransferase [Phycisphaerales bacterium]
MADAAFWDDRYAHEELVYGDAPNDFLAGLTPRLPRTGRALDLGAGQGRNALFLASRGLDVLAVDQSPVGMERAARLAHERGLSLRTQAADLREFDAEPASLDVVTCIFVHLPPPLRATVLARVRSWLRTGGLFVLEAYAPEQIGRGTGGPPDPTWYASLETIERELGGLAIEHRAAIEREVNEGRFHRGTASVVQVVARRE